MAEATVGSVRKSYFGKLVDHAWAATRHSFGLHRETLGIAVLPFLFGDALYWWFYGWGPMMDQVIPMLVWGLGGVGAAAIIFFLFNLITAPARMQHDADAANKALQERLDAVAQTRANLEVRFNGDIEPFKILNKGSHSYCRFSVVNNGPATAENVVVSLTDVVPRPKIPDGNYPPHFPSVVKRITNIDALELHINKGGEIWFEPIQAWRSNQETLIIQPMGGVNAQIPVANGDHWEMMFSVQAANADEVIFTIAAAMEAGDLRFARKQ